MSKEILTPFYAAHADAPSRVGPYRCRIVHPESRKPASDATHMRWFDGKFWSLPIVADDLIGDLSAPPGECFLVDDDMRDGQLETIEWQGYVEDQDPL